MRAQARASRVSRAAGAERAAPRAQIAVADVPHAVSVFTHIRKNYDYELACARVAPRAPVDGLLRLALPRPLLSGLRTAAKEAIARYGLHPWLSKEGRPGRSSYESLSLTYNPDLRDPGITDVHQSTLGTSANSMREHYYGASQHLPGIKNTYFDTYGFRLPTPAAKVGGLGRFLSGCKLSLVRSRLSVLYGDDMDEITPEYGWHRDEPVFNNLRVNIPLVTHRNYRLQIEHACDVPAANSPTTTTHYLKSGYAYTFDTHRPHRVFPIGPCRIMRVHLVLGFAPWFDYDSSRDAWTINRYYGRVHPFDILRSGGLHPALTAREESR
jgi:hypothetical protein